LPALREVEKAARRAVGRSAEDSRKFEVKVHPFDVAVHKALRHRKPADPDCADPAAFMSEAFARATGREHVDVTRFPETKEALDAVMRTLPPHLSEVAVALLQCTRRGTCIRLGMSRRQLDQLTDEIRRICNLIDLHP